MIDLPEEVPCRYAYSLCAAQLRDLLRPAEQEIERLDPPVCDGIRAFQALEFTRPLIRRQVYNCKKNPIYGPL